MRHAGPRSFRSSRAFLVRAQDLGELDRRLVFFTEAAGAVTLVAKSARHSRKRFGGTLQRYLLLNLEWTDAPGRMGVLSQATVARSFWEIVGDWEKVRHADHLLELSVSLFPQPNPAPKAFEVLLAGIRATAEGEPPAAVALKAEAAFLSVGGWGPDLSGCRRCKASDPALFRFLPSEGGLLCGKCRGGAGTRLTLGAVKTWRALQTTPAAALRRIRIPETILSELQGVLSQYLAWHLGMELRSLGGPARDGKS